MKRVFKVLTVTVLLISSTVSINAEEKIKKEESLYVVMDSNGTATNKQVNVNLESDARIKKYEDQTNLKNITVINGDADFTIDNNMINWESDEKSIQYKGDYEGKLPIKPVIKYTFNEKRQAPSEFVGLDGKIELDIDFHNDDKIDDVLTPYVVLSVIPLNEEHFTNIQASNSLLKSDGQTTYVLSLRVPGFNELDKLNESINITADVNEFKMDSVYFFAFPADMDLEDLKEEVNEIIDEVLAGSQALKDGTEALSDGAMQLKDGSNQLFAGSNLLLDALHQAEQGSTEIVNGQNKLLAGQAQFHTGLLKLSDGLQKANEIKQLETGSHQINNALKKASTGSSALTSGMNDLNKGASELNMGLEQLDQGITALVSKINQIDETELDAYIAYIQAFKAKLANLSPEEIGMMLEMFGLEMENLQILDQIESELVKYKEQIERSKLEANQLNEGSKKLVLGFGKLNEGSKTVSKGLTDLNQGLSELTGKYSNEFHPGIVSLSQGMDLLNTGQKDLVAANEEIMSHGKKLSQAQSSLSSGLKEIYMNDKKLHQGINDLSEGTNALYEGSVALNDGVGELFDGVNGFIKELDGVNEFENNRVSLTGENKNTDHSYKIVMKLNSIEMEQEIVEEEEVEEKVTFWDWLFRRNKKSE